MGIMYARNTKLAALGFILFQFVQPALGQHFKRLGTCPTLGCVLPPDLTDFYPGQLFDIRLEVHAPLNGSEAFNGGKVNDQFSFCIQSGTSGHENDGHGNGGGNNCEDAAKFFGVKEPALEKWSFTYFEDLFAQDANQPTLVNVASKAYRGVHLSQPGDYSAILTFNGKGQTVARWTVRTASKKQTAKNVLFFIGDGMTQAMITAARLISHKSINGRYQTLMQLDQMDALGIQMTHSIDSFITDSANSATALFSGKKSTVSALNVWVDSSANSFDDPKMETVAELFRRRRKGGALGTSPPKPDRWGVKDTSVIIASALHIAAQNEMLPAINPNNTWTSGVTRPNPAVPRSTSVEYEKETQTTTTRRLAPPPNRFTRPPSSRKPISKNASVRLVPDSEGEEDSSAPSPAKGRGKSPFEHVVDAAKKVLKPATYYVRQLSLEPEDRSHSTNGNTTHNRDTSYDYAAEEQEFQEAQQAKRTSLSAHKRGRMPMDNRAYKPSASDIEGDDDEYSDEDKRKRRKKKKKNEPVGGPLTTLPVLSADRKKKRKSRGTKSGVPGQDDEESESDEEPSVEPESMQAQQRSSVSRSLQPASYDISMQDSSVDTAEQGLDSIPELPEEELPSSHQPKRARSREKSVSRRVPRSSSRPPRESTRPVLWLRTSDLSLAAKLIKYLTLGALAYAVWYGLMETDIASHLPTLSLSRPSSRPIYTAPEVPAADIAELSERLQRIEVALSGLSRDSEQIRAKTEDGVRSHSELMGRLGALESRLATESKRLVESEVKVKDALSLGTSVSSVKREIEVLQAQLKAQEKQRQQDDQQHRADHINDEEARAKLRALEDRVGSVEGGVKEAIELGKKAVSTSANTKSPTIKVPGGQDLKSIIKDVVDDAVLLFSKDTIGKADYAMHANGARVIPSLTSASFELQPHSMRSQIAGFFTGYGSAVGRPPVTALHHESHGGYCWPFVGSPGQLGVSLAAPIIIDEVTIDHVAKEVAINIASAPKLCEVWAMIEGEENEKKYLEIIEVREKARVKSADAEGLAEAEEHPVTLPHNPPYLRIANFTYDAESAKNVQTFSIDEDVKEKQMDFGIVVLRVLDNWGMEKYTCLYRFRVHGTPLGPMQIPEPVEDIGL
ncbi:Spindle pole body-associated protein sad1 [Leucoagaricus sp. SymC.cos]|nr:Spindle pole body-associated protein sad1 [Leucoagaricus sp. SymC.cos]